MKFEQQQRLGGINNPNAGLSRGFQSAANATMAIADAMERHGQFGIENYQQWRVDSAERAASEIDPSTDEPELRSNMTLTGQAYNDIVIAGHAGAIKIDNSRHIAELATQYEGNPQGFETAATAYRNEMLNGVLPEIRQRAALDFDASASRVFFELNEKFKAKQIEESFNSVISASQIFFDDAARAARSGDMQALEYNLAAMEEQAAVLEEMGQADAAAQMRANMNERIDKQLVLGQADAAIQSGNGDRFIRSFIQNPPKDLTPEQADSYAATMVTMNNRYQSTIKVQAAARNVELERRISNLQIGAKNGLGDPEQIVTETEELFNAGHISIAQRTSIFNNLAQAEQRSQENADRTVTVAQRLSGRSDVYVAPADQDFYYDEVFAPMLSGVDPADAQMMQIEYVDSMKRVPTALKNQLQTAVMSGEPELIVQAASMVDKIDDIPGLVGDVFTPEQKALMQNVIELLPNMSPVEAVRIARQNASSENQAFVESRQAQLKEMETGRSGIDYRAEVESVFGSWFRSPDLQGVSGADIEREYRNAFQQHFKAGMSEDAAKREAEKMIRRTWSEFDGYVMKYAPNNFPAYVVAGSTDYIKDQLFEDMSNEMLFDEPLTRDNLRIYSVEETARTAATGLPRYRVAIIKDETITPVYGYWFQPDPDAQRAKIEEQNRSLIEDAESSRAASRLSKPAGSASGVLGLDSGIDSILSN